MLNVRQQLKEEREKRMTMQFNQFNDVQHMPLRVFNRAVFASNLAEDFGVDTAKQYFETFSELDKKQIYVMVSYIKKFGVEQTKKVVTNGLEVKYNSEEELV